MVTPFFLVRIFDVSTYGQYREFLLYAMLFSNVFGFSIKTNLLYFIPKFPQYEKKSVTNTTVLLLLISLVGCGGIYFFKGIILAQTEFNVILPVILFVFFFVNFDFFEEYWLGKKRPEYVLYYSTIRVVVRMVIVITTAYIFKDVGMVITSIIALEVLKNFIVIILFRQKFTTVLDAKLMKEQLSYIVPLGFADVVYIFNNQLSKLFVSITMGASSLAIYTIGSYQNPIMGIIRRSVVDSMFPEMAQKKHAHERILIWQKANVLFCFVIFPIFLVFFYFATPIIQLLFTEKYLSAVPIFKIYLLLMIRQCFEMVTPLRAINKNKILAVGNIIFLLVNLGFIFLFYGYLGILAPAVAFILGDAVAAVYEGVYILRYYNLPISELLMWRKIAIIGGVCCAVFPCLLLSKVIALHNIIEIIFLSALYFVIYFLILKLFHIEEIEKIINKFKSRFLKKTS